MSTLPQRSLWLGIIVALYTLSGSAIVEAAPAYTLGTTRSIKPDVGLTRPVTVDLRLALGPPTSSEKFRVEDPAKVRGNAGRSDAADYMNIPTDPRFDLGLHRDYLKLSLEPSAPKTLANGAGKKPIHPQLDLEMHAIKTPAGAPVNYEGVSSQLPHDFGQKAISQGMYEPQLSLGPPNLQRSALLRQFRGSAGSQPSIGKAGSSLKSVNPKKIQPTLFHSKFKKSPHLRVMMHDSRTNRYFSRPIEGYSLPGKSPIGRGPSSQAARMPQPSADLNAPKFHTRVELSLKQIRMIEKSLFNIEFRNSERVHERPTESNLPHKRQRKSL
ncbi:hypothetical protein PtA15_8A336 [Puccinia triticina]|uniref:Uncharacterized protein n=1 Tax=Puccinia triticina TaxID=208348 RepID=A0ABY7CXI7_9BASI|nr:uncharacterized protein PtA15_8A336 [Puccinia triticina]WAQ87432.1 hypothetical protein PtA15_8A336 [Puccinia triticina]WAR57285.1 hypothetical protein PtB15_8B332 [Puccinia triticina]